MWKKYQIKNLIFGRNIHVKVSIVIAAGCIFFATWSFALRSSDHGIGIVKSVVAKKQFQKISVYNLSVAQNENYYVGHRSMLVHNCSIRTGDITLGPDDYVYRWVDPQYVGVAGQADRVPGMTSFSANRRYHFPSDNVRATGNEVLTRTKVKDLLAQGEHVPLEQALKDAYLPTPELDALRAGRGLRPYRLTGNELAEAAENAAAWEKTPTFELRFRLLPDARFPAEVIPVPSDFIPGMYHPSLTRITVSPVKAGK